MVDAQALAENPRMATQIDWEAFSDAYDVVSRYLAEIDSAAERSRKRYNLMAAIAAQVLLAVAAFAALLSWRGYI